MVRSYNELQSIDTFEERFRYLALRGRVGAETFGFDRYLNQQFYRSTQWRHIRHAVIARDLGCDLGVIGYEIHDAIHIHHLNPMTIEEIKQGHPGILDLDNLISTTHSTHNAIHYGDARLLPRQVVERKRGDTKLW